MRPFLIINFLIIYFLIAGCQKKDETPLQPNKVTFDIVSPHESQIYKNGDTIFIKANVSYVSQLHGYSVEISDKATGTVVYHNEDHAHADYFSIDEYWVDSLDNDNKMLKLEITAIIDHENNTIQKQIELKHQP